MTGRKERADAVRNREAVLTAADELFARHQSPGGVSMDEIAAAAGVGKGTLFRRFGDRTGLVRALADLRTAELRDAVENGPPPLGPATPPRERVAAILDALLRFKLDSRHLALALESRADGSPYQGTYYDWWHAVIRDLLERLPGEGHGDSGFTAHALLAATRADLIEHLASGGDTPDRIRERLAAFVAAVLSP
ncbi:TetR/AcrR family transcriptional regulator [Streptomyces scopuliridis]